MKFGYTIIYVEHVEKTVNFYEKTFGLSRRFIHESGQYAEMETGATALAFASESLAAHSFVSNRLNHSPAGAEVAFVVDDVTTAYEHAIKSGATKVMEPTSKPWGQIVSYVRDNNGFLVELCSEVKAS